MDSNFCFYVGNATCIAQTSAKPYFQETADISFVPGVHEYNIFKKPEEWSRVILLGLHDVQQSVVLKEEPSCALCKNERFAISDELILP